eukprot:365572-Chlamydomonas_euryale.AAC.4
MRQRHRGKGPPPRPPPPPPPPPGQARRCRTGRREQRDRGLVAGAAVPAASGSCWSHASRDGLRNGQRAGAAAAAIAATRMPSVAARRAAGNAEQREKAGGRACSRGALAAARRARGGWP